MHTRLDFEHDYTVEEVRELFGGAPSLRRLYFPPGSERGGRDGVILKVTPNQAQAWIGVFAFGMTSRNSLTEVISCPNPRTLCVVSSGAGYFVDASEPSIWEKARAVPVCYARAVPTTNLLVLADFTKVVAYGPTGLKWESARLSSDGIDIAQIGPERIDVIGWDAAKERKTRISLSLEDGSTLSN